MWNAHPPPSLVKLLLTRDTKREAAARRVWDSVPIPANGGIDGGSSLGAGKGGGGGETHVHLRITARG